MQTHQSGCAQSEPCAYWEPAFGNNAGVDGELLHKVDMGGEVRILDDPACGVLARTTPISLQ